MLTLRFGRKKGRFFYSKWRLGGEHHIFSIASLLACGAGLLFYWRLGVGCSVWLVYSGFFFFEVQCVCEPELACLMPWCSATRLQAPYHVSLFGVQPPLCTQECSVFLENWFLKEGVGGWLIAIDGEDPFFFCSICWFFQKLPKKKKLLKSTSFINTEKSPSALGCSRRRNTYLRLFFPQISALRGGTSVLFWEKKNYNDIHFMWHFTVSCVHCCFILLYFLLRLWTMQCTGK